MRFCLQTSAKHPYLISEHGLDCPTWTSLKLHTLHQDMLRDNMAHSLRILLILCTVSIIWRYEVKVKLSMVSMIAQYA